MASARTWLKRGAGVALAPVTGGASLLPSVQERGLSSLEGIGRASGILGPEESGALAEYGDVSKMSADDRTRAIAKQAEVDKLLAEGYDLANARAKADVQFNPATIGERRTVTTVDQPLDVQQRDVNAHDVGSVERVAAPDLKDPRNAEFDFKGELGDAKLAGQTNVEKTSIDRGEARGIRNEQIAAARANANAPSAAAFQFKAALMAAQEAQLGAASQARGAERAGARREAVLGMGRDALQAAEKSAELAAREGQEKARAYSGALSDVASSDVDVAKSDAQIQAARANTQGQIDVTTAGANADRVNDRQTAKVGLDLDVTKTKSALDVGNIERSFEADKTRSANTLQAGIVNAGAENTRKTGNADRRTETEIGNANRGVSVDTGNRDRTVGINTTNAGIKNQADSDNIDISRKNAQARYDAKLAEEDAKGNRIGQAAGIASTIAAAPDRISQSTEQQLGISSAKAGALEARAAAKRASDQALLGTATRIGAGLASGGTSEVARGAAAGPTSLAKTAPPKPAHVSIFTTKQAQTVTPAVDPTAAALDEAAAKAKRERGGK